MNRRALLLLLALAGCGYQYETPAERANDARFGRVAGTAPAHVDCRKWAATFESIDAYALSHVSYPEWDPQAACYTPVVHDRNGARPDAPTPRGCAFPDEAARARIDALATALERRDHGAVETFFGCPLNDRQRNAAIDHDVKVLRRLAGDTHEYPYAALVIPGHGLPANDGTAIAKVLPEDACVPLGPGDIGRLGGNVPRAKRAAEALAGDVAPIAIMSGGAIHSHMVEAFALAELASCEYGADPMRLLVEPCAEHTHTNLRNGGRWIVALGGRAGYLLTDDFIQARYFQDWSGFELLLGSVDQRSYRDFGYLLGSWRQASRGINAGFWFTPYRFWGEPRDGLGSFTCLTADPATP